MAVYTDVAAEDLVAFLADYDIGELLAYKGIAEGVENSNFLVHASRGYFILTLYEKRVAGDQPRRWRGLAPGFWRPVSSSVNTPPSRHRP